MDTEANKRTSEEYLTIKELAKRCKLTKNKISWAIRQGVVPKSFIKYVKIKFYKAFIIKAEGAEYIKNFYKTPEGWLKIGELIKRLGRTSSNSFYRQLKRIPDFEKYVKVVAGKNYYDPALIPLIESMKRPFVHLVKQPQEGQEWFTPREFIALFGRSMECFEHWLERGSIPAELVRRNERGHRLLSREAIACIDGVLLDYSQNNIHKRVALEPESAEIIEMDGYFLTIEEHRRRLELRERGLNARVDGKAAC